MNGCFPLRPVVLRNFPFRTDGNKIISRCCLVFSLNPSNATDLDFRREKGKKYLRDDSTAKGAARCAVPILHAVHHHHLKLVVVRFLRGSAVRLSTRSCTHRLCRHGKHPFHPHCVALSVLELPVLEPNAAQDTTELFLLCSRRSISNPRFSAVANGVLDGLAVWLDACYSRHVNFSADLHDACRALLSLARLCLEALEAVAALLRRANANVDC